MRPTSRPLLPGPLAALALAALSAGCAQKPDEASCATHADCPSGTTCQQGICQDGLALELTAPAAAVTYANGSVPCQVTVTGAAPGAVQLVVDGVPVQTLVAPFAGSLATGGLAEGSHTLVAVAESGGRSFVSPPRTLVVDRTAPAAPALGGATTNAADPVAVSGTWSTDSGAPVTIAVLEGGTEKASGIVPGVGGAWTAGIALSEGAHELTARATDAAGNASGLSGAATITVDRTAPPVPAVTAATTNAADPVTVQGTIAADAGTPVTVTLYEGATVKQSAIVPTGTTWSATFALGEGSHGLTARAVDAAGNASALSAASTVLVDRTAPATPTVGSTYTNAADPVPVSGTLAADGGTAQTVAVYEGATQLASGILPTGTAWTTSLVLPEGSHVLTARAYDLAGNVSNPSSAGTVWVDRTTPAAPAVNAATTNAANPVTVSGTWTTGDTGSPVTIAIFEGATQLVAGLVPGAGAWSGAVPLAEGSHGLTARAIDAAGNVSAPSAPATIAVDRTAPPVPTIAALTTGAVNPVTVSGTIATDGGTALHVVVYEGATVLHAGVTPSGTSWSAPVSLAEGNHSLTVRAVDAAGNSSAASAAASVIVDRTMPAAPTLTSVYTSAADPVPISGTLTPDSGTGLTISVYEGASLRASGIVPSGTSWTTSLALSEGSHALTARAVDLAGNVSNPSASGTVWVDRTNPVAPAVNALTTNATNPVTVTGTWTTGDTGSPVAITVYEGATVLASGITPTAGSWSAGVTLSEASHSLTARAFDLAGNPSALSPAASVVVDRTLPPIPTVDARTTNAANPVTVTGTIAADTGTAVTVTVYEGATVLRSGVVPSGTSWSTTVTLGEGTHLLTVRSLDAAGNPSGLSVGASVVVDRTAPATPTVTSTRTSQLNPVTVSGTWTPDAGSPVTITVYEGTTVLGSNISPTGSTWSAAFNLTEGPHLLTAIAFDAAANVSGRSPVGTVIVDWTDPWITGNVPLNGATNVWTRDAITVTFSEAMAAGSISDATVTLSGATGGPVAKSAVLSPDGLTLTVRPIALPPVPDAFTIGLNGLTDLSGRSLPIASWSWNAPEWQDLGLAVGAASRSSLLQPGMAVGSDGVPVVAGSWIGSGSGFDVRRYTGDSAQPWQSLPLPTPTGPVNFSALAAAGGQDITGAFGTMTTDVWAAHYTGSVWEGGAVLDFTPTNSAKTPSVALDAGGSPYVAWVETVGAVDQVFAARWSGAAWTRLGSGPLSTPTIPASAPITTSGSTRVAWVEADGASTVVRGSAWSGSAWGTPTSGTANMGLSGAVPPAIAFSGAGTLYAMLLTTPGRVQVFKWVLGGVYVPSHWEQVGADLNMGTGAASAPTMALDPSGEPVVAWLEAASGTGFWVKRHDATAGWVSLTKTALAGATYGSLKVPIAVSSGGVVVLGRYVSLGLSTGLAVERYNR